MSDKPNTTDEIRNSVRENYAAVALSNSGCLPSEVESGCCGTDLSETRALGVGYSEAELAAVPDDSNMGLGCGNPTAIAGLKAGQTVLDLGAGGGFDCFLAVQKVGPSGLVIGVDMTPDMIDKARRNAEKVEVDNVEFRLGEIEHLPVADNSVDVIISNCVICLSPDKDAVFQESFRVLSPGGRIHVSDMVATSPEGPTRTDPEAWASCIAGAEDRDVYLGRLTKAGFVDIQTTEERVKFDDQGGPLNVASVKVVANKPA